MSDDRDITERLRGSIREANWKVRDEAADEIERLRKQLRLANIDCFSMEAERDKLSADNTRLRAALERIADTDPDDGTAWFHEAARAALNGGRDE